MTSQKSLQNNFGYAFRTGVRNNAIVGAAVAAFLAIIYCYIPIGTFSSATSKLKYDFILSSNMEFLRYLVIIGLLGLGILMGITAFKFITGKKTINVYYSLGIKRTHLFAAKFLSGAVVLAAAIALPLLICLIANTIYLGFSKYLMIAIVYTFLGLFAIAFSAFSITSLIFSTVGTAFEGVLFSGIVVLFPEIVLTCVQSLVSKYVFGSPFGQSFSRNASYGGNYKLSLSQKFAQFNPLRFMSEGIYTYQTATDKHELTSYTSGDAIAWQNPNFLPVICWILASIAIFALAIYAYDKRKAEIGGFIGKNKVLNFAGSFLISFFLFTSIVTYPFENLSNIVVLLIGLAVFLVVSVIIHLVLFRNLKVFRKNLLTFPIQILIVVALFVVFSTSYFGLANKVPETSEISYAQISSVTQNDVAEDDTDYTYFGSNQLSFINVSHPLGKYETENDINFVRDIHESIVNTGKQTATILDNEFNGVYPVAVQIKYVLKDGSVIYRNYYGVTQETIDKLNAADQTDYRKARLDDIFHGSFDANLTLKEKPTTDETIAYNYNYYKLNLRGEGTPVTIANNMLGNEEELELTEEQKNNLRECIYKDLTTISANDKYNPSETLGVISFGTQSQKQGGDVYYETTTVSSDGVETVTGSFADSVSWLNADVPAFIVTPAMTNTINCLKTLGYYDLLTSTQKIKAVTVLKVSDVYSSGYVARYIRGEIASGGSSLGCETIGYRSGEKEYVKNNYEGAYSSTDTETISSLVKVSVLRTPVDADDYIAVFSIEDGTSYRCVIPAEKVSDAVKNSVTTAAFTIDSW